MSADRNRIIVDNRTIGTEHAEVSEGSNGSSVAVLIKAADGALIGRRERAFSSIRTERAGSRRLVAVSTVRAHQTHARRTTCIGVLAACAWSAVGDADVLAEYGRVVRNDASRWARTATGLIDLVLVLVDGANRAILAARVAIHAEIPSVAQTLVLGVVGFRIAAVDGRTSGRTSVARPSWRVVSVLVIRTSRAGGAVRGAVCSERAPGAGPGSILILSSGTRRAVRGAIVGTECRGVVTNDETRGAACARRGSPVLCVLIELANRATGSTRTVAARGSNDALAIIVRIVIRRNPNSRLCRIRLTA